MGQIFSIIKPGVRGVDGHSDPLRLQGAAMRHSVNLQYQSGRILTRPPFQYMKVGLKGQFQGATMFRPSKGISFRPFAPCGTRLATAVNNKIYVNNAPATGVQCNPMELKAPAAAVKCGLPLDEFCIGDIHLYQAENILVIQSPRRNTMWWTGTGDLVVSPGMADDATQGAQHSHDTFQDGLHKNFLINSAGVGAFWHGRIHQAGQYGVYVSDNIHKRGDLGTGDIILMEEQSTDDPLSTNSKMGALLALEGLPQMGTPNGEGSLIGYYDGGIVEYNTFQFPRATERTAKGELIAEGWDRKQMVKHNCNVVSATGRYAVAVLPRDHFFRSGFGIHVLSQVLGVEFIRDEPVNVISDEVSNVLLEDDPDLLHGAAAGCWFQGHRWFMTCGFENLAEVSSSPMGRGFVSWNKVWDKTADKTPQTAWEGVWIVDEGMAGIHRFIHPGIRDDRGAFGFLASDTDKNVWFAAIRPDGAHDLRDGKTVPIPWALETGRFDFKDTTRTKTVVEGRFEGIFHSKGAKVTVYLRTDRNPQWQKWTHFTPCERDLKPGERMKASKPLGRPPDGWEEATWFEFRIEGTAATEILGFDVEISEGSGKMDIDDCHIVNECLTTYPLTAAL